MLGATNKTTDFMSQYRKQLPQLEDSVFLTDGGLETTLVFHEGTPLPHFAAFDLLKDETGIGILRRYFECYINVARAGGLGIVLESPTWRASQDWAKRLGYGAHALAEANRNAIKLLDQIRSNLAPDGPPVVISGNLGPRGDGYRVDSRLSVREAREYHSTQIETFAATRADMVAAFTMTHVEEAIGIALAARDAEMPLALSFTVETDGRLPSGQPLAEAIEATDDATGGYPSYFMINCAHPSHFRHVLERRGSWRERIRGLRANASRRSHAELDASTDLDVGNPNELGEDYRALRAILPGLSVLGGCCGTDHRHVEAIAHACLQGSGECFDRTQKHLP
jgi:homocysteine S-methyltransferase